MHAYIHTYIYRYIYIHTRGVPKIFVRHGGNCYNYAHSNFVVAGSRKALVRVCLPLRCHKLLSWNAQAQTEQSGLFLKFLSVLVHCASPHGSYNKPYSHWKISRPQEAENLLVVQEGPDIYRIVCYRQILTYIGGSADNHC